MVDTNNASKPKSTGVFEYSIFIAALVSGTACSICSKTMMQMTSIGKSGTTESFSKPIFQTFGMFVGMMFGLVMHYIVKRFRIEFPGYEHPPPSSVNGKNSAKTISYGTIPTTAHIPNTDPNEVPYWMLLFLAIPSIFDLAATALCMMGLQYLNVSIYQLLRGSGIIFVALLKQYWLDHPLYTFQWIGVSYNVVSVFLVSATAVLGTSADAGAVQEDDSASSGASASAVVGVGLVLAGALVQALQFVFEEKVMTMDESAAPPLLLIGMEGLWGTLLCVTVVYPMATFVLPGNDWNGSYEDMGNTMTMIANSKTIQYSFIAYFLAIFSYNLFAVLVTFCLNSIWHAILDNFRPLTVWATGVSMFYLGRNRAFGEPWTIYSWIQVLGMVVLLYGTAIYNAPNPGSVRLKGQWWNFGLNFTQEYDDLEEEAHWEGKKIDQRRASSVAEMSPFIMQNTMRQRQQALLHQPSVVVEGKVSESLIV